LIKLKEGERMQGLERIEENVDENAKRELAHAEAAEGEEALDDGVVAEDAADDVVDDAADEASDE
jgi:DNA gyrase subunit A